jgi:succinate dehydrogenase/fumarate reductase flavoprotein subunit
VDEHARTSVPGLHAAGDLAAVPHNYMLGAFVYGQFADESSAAWCASHALPAVPADQLNRELARVSAPLLRGEGLPAGQVEYKLRRLVNDYLQPPKITRRMEIGLTRFETIGDDLAQLSARDPHELMRAMEVHAIRDCAEMAARASLFRTESRWGLYHARVDYPERDDANWFVHAQLVKDDPSNPDAAWRSFKRPVEPYVVPMDDPQRRAYQQLRIQSPTAEPVT